MGQGYIHIYTGNGKGKTTAAFGLAIRALCAGKNVAIGQFVKSMKYNETKAEALFNGANPRIWAATYRAVGLWLLPRQNAR